MPPSPDGRHVADHASDVEFRNAAHAALKALLEQIDNVDDDDIDARVSEGSLVVSFDSGGTYMLSLQAPTHELWLSANLTAWHFRRNGSGTWIERDSGEPMSAILGRLFSEKLGTPVKLEL
jgi:iron donor protein CyaY